MNVTDWCNRIIRWGFYLLFILVPLILTPWNFELFEYNKMMLTYAIAVAIAGAWIVKMVNTRELKIAKTPLDIPLWLFVASQFISTLFSIDPHVSWFGYYSRFNGGMFSIFTYTVLYYAFITNFGIIAAPLASKLKNAHLTASVSYRVTRLIKVMVTTAAVVAIYGVLEHFGIDKNLWVQDVQSRVFSTLGQPNWLAAYLVVLIPAGIALAMASESMLSFGFIMWGLIAFLFFVVLLFTRSRSGYLGLAVADVIYWGILWCTTKKKQSLKLPFLVIHAALFLFVFFNGTYIEQVDPWITFSGWKARLTRHQTTIPKPQVAPSGTALEFGGTESGTIRKYVWEGAVNAWKANTKNMLVGTGTETFAFAFYQYRPAAHNLTSEWDFLYNKAHNEYLNYLATTGVLGLASYLLLIGVFIWWFVSHVLFHVKSKSSDIAHGPMTLEIGLFAGWFSILVTNFFGFSVVIMQLLLFLIPPMLLVMARESKSETEMGILPLHFSDTVKNVIMLAIVLAGGSILVSLYRFWQADTDYALANRIEQAAQYAQAQALDAKAIALNPGEPVYHDDMASVLSSLSLAAAQGKNATLAATLAKQSLAESDRAIAISPKNVIFWKTRTKLFYTFSIFDPSLNQQAINALETAKSLSPTDPKIYYNLAILYGRAGDNASAVKLLEEAKILKKDYRDAYFGLYVFYTDMKEPALAKKELQDYLTNIDPNDKDFQSRLASP